MAISGVNVSAHSYNQVLGAKESNLDRDKNSSIISNDVNGSKSVVPIVDMAKPNLPVMDQFGVNHNRIVPVIDVHKIRQEASQRAKVADSKADQAIFQKRSEDLEGQNERVYEEKSQEAVDLANRVVDKVVDRKSAKESVERHYEFLDIQEKIVAEIHGDLSAASAANAALNKIIERRLASEHLELRDEILDVQASVAAEKHGEVTSADAGNAALNKSLDRKEAEDLRERTKLQDDKTASAKDNVSPANRKVINAFAVQREGDIQGRVIDLEI